MKKRVNYDFERRKKEQDRQRKKEEKLQRKQDSRTRDDDASSASVPAIEGENRSTES